MRITLVVLAVLAVALTAVRSTAESEVLEPQALDRQAAEPSVALRGPVDDTIYIVGPGDRFTITVWGAAVAASQVIVAPDGHLVIPGVASIPVSGLTLADARGLIAEELGSVYRNVEFSISLTGLRRVRVNVLGEVEEPGAYVATALETASDLIARAGGLLETASRRNIVVTRGSGGTARVDLTRYLNAGDVSADAPILDGDVIYVPHMLQYVHVMGAVARPGRYEFVEDESARALLELAGGLGRAAVPDSAELRRFIDDRTTRPVSLDLTDARDLAVRIEPGDQLYVPARSDWREARFVRIEGEVTLPGYYGINDNVDRVSDIVERAGGPTGRASLHDALIIRLRPDDEPDPELERLQDIPVDQMTETEYAYLKTRYRQDMRSVVVDFEALLGGEETEDPLLKHNDRIIFPKARRTVLVSGQVMMPGHVRYESGERFRHYIELAGGFTDDANRGRVRVIRDGTGHQVSARRAREIFPGDEIWVPEAPEEDWWENVREVAAFLSSVATIYLVIDQGASN